MKYLKFILINMVIKPLAIMIFIGGFVVFILGGMLIGEHYSQQGSIWCLLGGVIGCAFYASILCAIDALANKNKE